MAALISPGSPESALRWDQVRAILWARRRLWWREANRSVWKGIQAVFSLLIAVSFVCFAVGAAVLVALWARQRGPETVRAAALAGHTLVLGILVVLPLVGLRANEFLDVTKLFLLPVSHRTVFAASLAGSFTAPGTIAITLALATGSALVAPSAAAAAVAALAALLLCALGVAAGQAILLLWLDVFRSRRFRDVSILVMTLFVAGTITAVRILAAKSGGVGGIVALQRVGGALEPLVFLPSWWSAEAATGSGVTSLLPAAALVPLVVWTVFAAARAQERALHGDIDVSPREAGGVRRGFLARWTERREGRLAAALAKDLTLLSREPGVRIQAIQQAAYSVVPIGIVLFRAAGDGGRASSASMLPWAGLLGTITVVMGFSSSLLNPLGTEGAGFAHALLLPAPRRFLLLSKAIALCAGLGFVAGLLGVGATVVVAVLRGAPVGETAVLCGISLVECVLVAGTTAAIGTVLGSFFPLTMVRRDRSALGQSVTRKPGCLRQFAGLFALAAAALTAGIVILLVRLPWIVNATGAGTISEGWTLVTVPVAVAATAGALLLGSTIGGARIESNEAAILEEMTKPQD